MRTVALTSALLLGLGVGCAGSQRFYWGSYDEAVLNAELSPSVAPTAGRDIANLEVVVERARARGGTPGPGVHAHLGYLYTVQGDLASAAQHFAEEKRLFPESAVMIDRLVEGLR